MQHFSQEDFSVSWQIHIPQTHFSKVNSSSSNFLPTLLKRKALPVAPVKRVEMSSERLVRIVSQFAQENRRVPPMWSKKILPIFTTYPSFYSRPESKKKHHVKKAFQQKNWNSQTSKNWNSQTSHIYGRIFFKPIQLMIAPSHSSVGELLNLQSAFTLSSRQAIPQSDHFTNKDY